MYDFYPYHIDAAKVSGTPKTMLFDYKELHFYFEFSTKKDQNVIFDNNGICWGQITEIYIPSYHYEDLQLEIEISDGIFRYDKERQSLYWRYDQDYDGKYGRDVEHFYEDEGIIDFVGSFISLFILMISQLFFIETTPKVNDQIVHWLYIRPAQK